MYSQDISSYREYQIGVDVHRGRFQYQQTRVVTFVAHYQLENRTQYKLAYLQRHQLQHEVILWGGGGRGGGGGGKERERERERERY